MTSRALLTAALVLLVTPLLCIPVWAAGVAEMPEVVPEEVLPEASPEVNLPLEAQVEAAEAQTLAPAEGADAFSDPLGEQTMSTFERCEVNPCPPGYICAMICGVPQCFKFL